ncbi:MAG: STAS domain-containing protein [gamma proteobacterium symbiont of Bathyaustriella thionipta]|nr:STAS domain-containing protein [gamma proteobacterium symbiont of Bathyaustriella thionipta]
MSNKTWGVQQQAEIFKISGVVDFSTVPDIEKAVRGKLQGHSDITIDFADVSRANSAALGLILEWRQTRAQGTQLHFVHLPGTLLDIARLCNIESLIRECDCSGSH